MVRKGIPNARAKRGIIPSDDPFKDRARNVYHLIKTFEHRFTESQRKDIANVAREILEVGDADNLFSGKDPFPSAVAIFVYLCRRFSFNQKCVVTYQDIRENVSRFSAGDSFVKMLATLKKRFG